jgi:hypothetical protein
MHVHRSRRRRESLRLLTPLGRPKSVSLRRIDFLKLGVISASTLGLHLRIRNRPARMGRSGCPWLGSADSSSTPSLTMQMAGGVSLSLHV